LLPCASGSAFALRLWPVSVYHDYVKNNFL